MTERTPEQARYETAWHEAGHAVAGYLLGHAIEKIELMSPDGELVNGRVAGHVIFAPRSIDNRHEALDQMIVSKAGEATCRIAWALGLMDEDLLGRTGATELTAEDILAVPPSASPVASAAYIGWAEEASTNGQYPFDSDTDAVHKLVAEFGPATDPGAMWRYAAALTADLVSTERFQWLVSLIVAALLEFGTLKGSHVTGLLQRRDAVFEPTEKVAAGDQ